MPRGHGTLLLRHVASPGVVQPAAPGSGVPGWLVTMTAAEAAALASLSRVVGEIDGKLDMVLATQAEHGMRLRTVEDAANADRAVASRVAAMRAEGTITKRWVINTLIAFVVAIATVAGLAIAVASQVIR